MPTKKAAKKIYLQTDIREQGHILVSDFFKALCLLL